MEHRDLNILKAIETDSSDLMNECEERIVSAIAIIHRESALYIKYKILNELFNSKGELKDG